MEHFVEISILLVIAACVSFGMRILKQPLVVGYILAGILAGPYVLGVMHNPEVIEIFSKIGITVLLFIVGLQLSPSVIREVGKVSLITGLGQVLFTSIIGFGLALLLGIAPLPAMYTAIALTFSSTIIILKLLSDKGDLNKLYGKIAIGFLLVQDIVATVILIVVTSIGTSGTDTAVADLALTFIKGGVIIAGLFYLSGTILPKLTKLIAMSQELLFLFSITWGLALASFFAEIGFSIEIGALISGVTLSVSPYAYEIGSRMRPLRDFFVILFFVLLGSQLVLSDFASLILPALVLSTFVLVGNPLIVFILMNILGFNKRTGFLAGLTVAQISEFSLILAAMGVSVGHLNQEILSLITLVGLITISVSTYMILYADKIYPFLLPFLNLLEFRKISANAAHVDGEAHEVLLFGYHRVGQDFVKAFDKLGRSYMVVDFNPQTIKRLINEGIPYRYGDADDVEFLAELELSQARMVVSTVPDFSTNMILTEYVHKTNPKSIIIVISNNIRDALKLYKSGATYVIMPHYLGAQYASEMIVRFGTAKSSFEKEQRSHLKYLEKRLQNFTLSMQ